MVRLFSAIWYKIFGEPSHAKAIKSINKALGKLDKAVHFQEAKRDFMEEAAKQAATAAKAAKDAAAKAGRVREKLADLFEA